MVYNGGYAYCLHLGWRLYQPLADFDLKEERTDANVTSSSLETHGNTEEQGLIRNILLMASFLCTPATIVKRVGVCCMSMHV